LHEQLNGLSRIFSRKNGGGRKIPLGITRFTDKEKAVKCFKRRFKNLFKSMQCNQHEVVVEISDLKPFNPLKKAKNE
jgi:hypothetical protein